ncbi:Gfo/Idh/MocA family oxidoreductase [Chloroflexi bacterium TSY]|nr:Gfo/Idh/MocA family oxidoreductase [Chloroflexi bacterium TSY]
MQTAKIAVIGCGPPSRRGHLPTIAELTKKGALEFVALCDLDENLAAQAGAQYGVPYYTDAEQMLDKHKDILVVDIVTGDPTHHSLAKLVAEHKMHPMVEKPMALTLPCCDVIVDACRKNGVHFEVAENYFRMPKEQMILKLIAEGVLGDIMRVHFIEPYRQTSFDPDAGKPRGIARPVSKFGSYSGVCMDMGAHRLSQIRLYANSEPRKIAAITKQFVPGPDKIYEDWVHAMIDFESGAVGIYETSMVGEETVKYSQISGTKGRIMDADYRGSHIPLRVIDNGKMKDIPVEYERHTVDGVDVLSRIVVHTEPAIVYENPFREYAINDWCVGHAEEIMSLANAALYDQEPEYGIGGRKDVEMCMAVYESSILGMTPVELPIRELTTYEQMLHDDFFEEFGYAIDKG